MKQIPFYLSPFKAQNSPDRPLRYNKETNEEKLKIIGVAQDVGIRKAAWLFKVSRGNIQRWLKQKDDIKIALGNNNKKGKEANIDTKKIIK